MVAAGPGLTSIYHMVNKRAYFSFSTTERVLQIWINKMLSSSLNQSWWKKNVFFMLSRLTPADDDGKMVVMAVEIP